MTAAGVRAERPSRFGPQIYGHLKDQLLSGAYECGDKLSVNDIREEFGTSRHPVLDALRMLEGDGLVEVLPQVGCRVRSYSAADVEDFFTLFGGLEGTVAGMAAERRTPRQMAHLNGLIEVDENGQASAAEVYQGRNALFHGTIHDMAASPIINATCARHWDLADFMVNTVGGLSSIADSLQERLEAHRAIAAAIEAGDATRAAREATDHVAQSTRAIVERIHSREG